MKIPRWRSYHISTSGPGPVVLLYFRVILEISFISLPLAKDIAQISDYTSKIVKYRRDVVEEGGEWRHGVVAEILKLQQQFISHLLRDQGDREWGI